MAFETAIAWRARNDAPYFCDGNRPSRQFVPAVVAQISNLLYRRIGFCGTLAGYRAIDPIGALPISNRRYGRVQLCVTRLAGSLRAQLADLRRGGSPRR
jgi:hypothetical protein